MTSTVDQCRIRDIPASCNCPWEYSTGPARWFRIGFHRNCPWHQQAAWLLENLHERHTGKMTRR